MASKPQSIRSFSMNPQQNACRNLDHAFPPFVPGYNQTSVYERAGFAVNRALDSDAISIRSRSSSKSRSRSKSRSKSVSRNQISPSPTPTPPPIPHQILTQIPHLQEPPISPTLVPPAINQQPTSPYQQNRLSTASSVYSNNDYLAEDSPRYDRTKSLLPYQRAQLAQETDESLQLPHTQDEFYPNLEAHQDSQDNTTSQDFQDLPDDPQLHDQLRLQEQLHDQLNQQLDYAAHLSQQPSISNISPPSANLYDPKYPYPSRQNSNASATSSATPHDQSFNSSPTSSIFSSGLNSQFDSTSSTLTSPIKSSTSSRFPPSISGSAPNSTFTSPTSANYPTHQTSPKQSKKGPCRGCGKPISGKSVASRDGKLTGRWHRQCFCCAGCGVTDFSQRPAGLPPGGTAEFYIYKDQPMCYACYHSSNNSFCRICGLGIEGRCLDDGFSRYHAECALCTTCQTPLTGLPENSAGDPPDVYVFNNELYCSTHGKELQNISGSNSKVERRFTRQIMM